MKKLKVMTIRRLPVDNADSSSSDPFQNVFGGGDPSVSMVQDGAALTVPMMHFAPRGRHSGQDPEVAVVVKKLNESDFGAII
jgi:hypothetical protein